jgi:hypothetical protein
MLKRHLFLFLVVGLLMSCVTEQKSTKLIGKSSPNSKVFSNTKDKHDFIVISGNGDVKRVETGGTFSAKVKKEYIYKER